MSGLSAIATRTQPMLKMTVDTIETLIDNSCDEPRATTGFMEWKIGKLSTSQPKLISQANQSSVRVERAPPVALSKFSSAPEQLVYDRKPAPQSNGLLKVKPVFQIVMPQGESASSAYIEMELDFLEDKVKPYRGLHPAAAEREAPTIKFIESSPARSFLGRGKSKTLNSPGFNMLRSLAIQDTESLNKTDNLSIDKEMQKQQSKKCVRKSSEVSNRSQRSILKQSATKEGANRPVKYCSVKDFEIAKKTVRGTAFSEFPQFAENKKVSFSKTNMLKLYSIDKKMAPLPPR